MSSLLCVGSGPNQVVPGQLITRDSQNSHKAMPLTSSPYQRSIKVIRGHQISSKAIKISHKCVLSKFHIDPPIKMSHQNVPSKCLPFFFSTFQLFNFWTFGPLNCQLISTFTILNVLFCDFAHFQRCFEFQLRLETD